MYGRSQVSCELTGRSLAARLALSSTSPPPLLLHFLVANVAMAELRAIGDRLRRLELDDLISISQATNGAVPSELISVVDDPQEVDYDEHSNPQMLFWMDDMRTSGELTPLEKQVVRMAQKEIIRRIIKRSRTGTLRPGANKRGGKKQGSKKSRKTRRTRRRR